MLIKNRACRSLIFYLLRRAIYFMRADTIYSRRVVAGRGRAEPAPPAARSSTVTPKVVSTRTDRSGSMCSRATAAKTTALPADDPQHSLRPPSHRLTSARVRIASAANTMAAVTRMAVTGSLSAILSPMGAAGTFAIITPSVVPTTTLVDVFLELE